MRSFGIQDVGFGGPIDYERSLVPEAESAAR
jgi:hypothetical protein